jgi:hypothetical protein
MQLEAIEKAKAKTVIAELDEPFLAALQEELYAKWYDQFVAKAREELTPVYEEKFARRCEHWQDEHAGYRKMVQDEHDNQRERDREQDRRRLRREFEEQLTEAKEAQTTAEQRLAEADEQLLTLISCLLPEGKKPFLHEYGIEALDVWGLNHILQRQGLEIAHTRTESQQRVVKVRTGEAAWDSATRFWLQPYEAPAEPKVNGIPLKYIAKF